MDMFHIKLKLSAGKSYQPCKRIGLRKYPKKLSCWRNSRSHLPASNGCFDVFLFWCMTSVRSLRGVVFWRSGSVYGLKVVKSCTYSRVQTVFAVRCITDRRTDRQHYHANSRSVQYDRLKIRRRVRVTKTLVRRSMGTMQSTEDGLIPLRHNTI